MPLWRANVRISHPALGGSGSNTWHLRENTPGLLNTENGDEIMGWVHSFYEAACQTIPSAGSVSFDGVLTGVGPNEGQSAEIAPWTQAGNNGGAVLPPANCVVVNWIGSVGDRSKRGRTFVGPIGVNQVASDGTPSAECLGTLRGAAAALLASSDNYDEGAIGIWSREESIFRDVVATGVHNQFAMLRSRRD